MLSKFRIISAQNLTKSSPVNSIPDAAIWLETSLDTSFKDAERKDTTALTSWHDSNNAATIKAVVSAVGSGPTYSNTISNIHAVEFVGSSSNYLRIEDARFLNDTDYTIFVLEKRKSDSANNYFIGGTSSNPNDALALGYSSESLVIHAQGSNSYTGAVDTYAATIDKPRIFTFFSDSNGKKTYVNGTLVGTSTSTARLSGLTTLDIGNGYTGEIGEIIMFSRALKLEERTATEDYLGKKWSRKITRDSVPSCTDGILTEAGCSHACLTSGVLGVSTPATVADGSSGSLTCNTTGYLGTVSYSCSLGILTPTGSCDCDTEAGYAMTSGVCQSSCSSGSTVGVPTTTVSTGSGTLSCTSTGYDASDSISYTCSGGTFTVTGGTSCDSCISGYTYGSGVCNENFNCTGGDSTTDLGGNRIHTFTTTGSASLVCSGATTSSFRVMLVGGGGSGGGSITVGGGGGGGGGQFIDSSGNSLSGGNTLTITVGGGGAAVSGNANGNRGSSSSLSGGSLSFTAYGGWGGGRPGANYGAADSTSPGGGQGSAGTFILGNKAGGRGTGSGSGMAGAGGGSSYAAGSNANMTVAGAGANGTSSDITGSTYGGGGGGGARDNPGGAGGTGGGGTGARSTTTGPALVSNPTNGSANTGGGGGGGGYNSNSGAGGSGIVIVSYPDPTP
ncbi:MAG: hypothetical protein KA100_00410 [Rickettsiales bacterium]|nr:hypothetical protein [Rickettsiales bacterium]